MANKQTKRVRAIRDGYKSKTGQAVSSRRPDGKALYKAPTQKVHPVSGLSVGSIKEMTRGARP